LEKEEEKVIVFLYFFLLIVEGFILTVLIYVPQLRSSVHLLLALTIYYFAVLYGLHLYLAKFGTMLLEKYKT
jgi:hypothetical protein